MCICRQIIFSIRGLINATIHCNLSGKSEQYRLKVIHAKVRMAQRRREKKIHGKKTLHVRAHRNYCSVFILRVDLSRSRFLFQFEFFFIAIEVDASYIHECDMHTAQCSLKRILVFYVLFFSRSLRNFSFRLIFTLSIDKI